MDLCRLQGIEEVMQNERHSGNFIQWVWDWNHNFISYCRNFGDISNWIAVLSCWCPMYSLFKPSLVFAAKLTWHFKYPWADELLFSNIVKIHVSMLAVFTCSIAFIMWHRLCRSASVHIRWLDKFTNKLNRHWRSKRIEVLQSAKKRGYDPWVKCYAHAIQPVACNSQQSMWSLIPIGKCSALHH